MLRTLLRWISRFFLLGLIAAAVGFVISRLMGQDDEEFDDFEDLDSNFEFQETPVEIDVPAADLPAPAMSEASAMGNSEEQVDATVVMGDSNFQAITGKRLIEINGIGPAYEAKLNAIGIHNIDDLAQADPGAIAEKVDIRGGAGEVTDWIAQAQSMRSLS